MNSTRTSRQGFTLTELVVVVAVVAFLSSAMLIPAFMAARENARRGQCVNNLREIGKNCLMYGGDNGDLVPWGTGSVFSNLALASKYVSANYRGSVVFLVCPGSKKHPAASFRDPTATDAANVSYSQAAGGAPGTIAQADPNDWEFWDQGIVGLSWGPTSNHKSDGGNVLFNDGHIAWQTKTPTNMPLGCLNP